MNDKHFMIDIRGKDFAIWSYQNKDGTYTAQAMGPIPRFEGIFTRDVIGIQIADTDERAIRELKQDLEDNLLIGIAELADYLDVSQYTARRTVIEHLWPVLTSSGDMFSKNDINQRKDEYIKRTSMNIEELALYLGIKRSSLESFIHQGDNGFPVHRNREDELFFVPYEIDDYFYKLFPDNTWSSVSSYSRDIADRLGLEIQNCEIEGCDQIGSKKCYECKKIICFEHLEWINNAKPPNLFPDVLCTECADNVHSGELNYKLVN